MRRGWRSPWRVGGSIALGFALLALIGSGAALMDERSGTSEARDAAARDEDATRSLEHKRERVLEDAEELTDELDAARDEVRTSDEADLRRISASRSWRRYEQLRAALDSAERGAERAATRASANAARVRQLRSEYRTEQPWYPRGFQIVDELSGVAMRWIDGGCTAYLGYCWSADVVSETGCPNSLYAEVKILSGGTNVGWTNDTAGSLSAGEVARLEFTHYSSGSGSLSARLADISCY